MNIKTYTLETIDQLNDELVENLSAINRLSFFNVVYLLIFNKEKLEKVGLIIAKMEMMIADRGFDEVVVVNPKKSRQYVDQFRSIATGILKHSRNRRALATIFMIAVTLLMFFWLEWEVAAILFGLLIWTPVKDLFAQQRLLKQLENWYQAAVEHLEKCENHATDQVMFSECDSNTDHTMSDALKYARYSAQKEQQDWAVKLFDFISGLFTRNKHDR